MKQLIILGLLLVLFTTVQAQPDSLWSRTYGGERDDVCYSMLETLDGGYLLGGNTRSYGQSGFWILKVDGNGDSLWSRCLRLGACYSIIQTSDSSFSAAGSGRGFSQVKTDGEGHVIWTRSFGGNGTNICKTHIQTENGGFALAGYTNSQGAGEADVWLVLTDENGYAIRTKTYGGRGDEWCSAIIQATDGGYMLAGGTTSFGSGGSDFWLIHTNENGDSLWSKTYGGRGEDRCHSIIQIEEGGFVLSGWTDSFGGGHGNMWLIRINEDGDSLWSRTYGGRDHDTCYSLIQTLDGGFALAGYTGSFGTGSYDMWLVRTDSDGEQLWSQHFGGEEVDWCFSVIQTVHGGFVLAGKTASFGSGEDDLWLVKTSPDPASVKNSDFILQPLSFTLSTYPNPFNSATTIRYGLSYPSNVSIQVYNPFGRRIGTLFEGYKQSGIYITSFDANELPSGLYFIRLYAAGKLFTQKIMLVR